MLTWRSLLAVLMRPWLWGAAVGAMFSLAPDRWWSKRPFLPIPDRSVVDWRVTTAYGHADMTLVPQDLVSYLQWRKRAR